MTSLLRFVQGQLFVDCNLWTRKANTAAKNGVFYGWRSESDCMATCLASTSCVAFDLGPIGCVLHTNGDDLTTAYYVSGVTQFVLNRHCLQTSTERLRTTTSSLGTTTGRPMSSAVLLVRLTVQEIIRFVVADSSFILGNNFS